MEQELENRFVEFLLNEKGFPRDRLLRGVAFLNPAGGSLYLDLAAVDPVQNEFVALFELKNVREHGMLRQAISQLALTRRVLGRPHTPAYVVYAPLESSARRFEICEVLDPPAPTGEDVRDIPLSEFPTYAALTSSNRAVGRVEKEISVRRTVDQFKVVCFVLAATVVAILALDVFGIYSMTAQQLTLSGIAALLVLLPYAAKFRMLGVEFERLAPIPEPHRTDTDRS